MTQISGRLAPLAPNQRIQDLDVVRGFALIGIMLMNIEFFNRTTHGIMEGMPAGLRGLDWAASWFIAYFVQGKFWTIFSMLFGMGFAVMLTRAERDERDFLWPYLRRIGALAVFGAAHYIFLWDGDILFSYALAAAALLILLYAKWKHILIALALLAAAGFIPGLDPVWGIAAALLSIGLNSLYLRSERQVSLRGASLPLFAFIQLVLGSVAVIAAVVLWSLPDGPKEPRVPVTMVSIGMLVIGVLAAKFHDPVEWRAGKFPLKVARDAGFAIVLVAMFLLGVWFVRSGVMENAQAHLPLFERLVLYGIPVGIGLGLLFSHWWLARYRFGPMEWFWRGFTYRETPAVRR